MSQNNDLPNKSGLPKNFTRISLQIIRDALVWVICLFMSQSIFADTGADFAGMVFKAGQAPGFESCSVGRNLMSGEAEYDQTDITGPLPYIRHYSTTLARDRNRIYDMTNGVKSIGGWTDNYSNDAMIQSISGSSDLLVLLRLPGDTDDTPYRISASAPYTVTRMYNIAPFDLTDISGYEIASNFTTDLGDRALVVTNAPGTTLNAGNLSFSVNYKGVIYQFLPQVFDGGANWIYKMVRVIYPDGKVLGLSYDSGSAALITVADNRGHLLTINRTIHIDGGATRSLINSVTLSAQPGFPSLPDQQQVTYQYQTSDWYDFNNVDEKLYTISSATSGLYGTESYTYTPVSLAAYEDIPFANNNNGSEPSHEVQVLTSVINNDSVAQLKWEYDEIQLSDDPSGNGWAYLSATYRPTASGDVEKVTTDEAIMHTPAEGFQNTSQLVNQNYSVYFNGQSNPGTGTLTTLNYNGEFNTNAAIMYQYFAFGGSSLGFPCVTFNKVPVKEQAVDISLNQTQDVWDANNNHYHFTYDDLNRVLTEVEATGSSLARTTTYTYGPLSDGSANIYNIPTEIDEPEETIKNTIEPGGRVTQTVKSYTQSGSQTSPLQTWTYSYYEDPTQSNYGLLQHAAKPRESAGQMADSIWYTYDQFGNVLTSSRHVTHENTGADTIYTTTYSNYNSAGQPQNITYPDGTTDTISYNSAFKILTKVHGNSSATQTTKNTYNDLEQLTSSMDADGFVTNYVYDSLGRLFTKTYPNGNKDVYSYWGNDEVSEISHQLPSGAVVASSWQTLDTNGRVNNKREGSNTNQMWTSMTYDANGNILQTNTAAGITNSWTYDVLNRVATHTDGNGNVDNKGFDDANNNTNEMASNVTGSSRYFKNHDILEIERNSDFGEKDYYHDYDNNMYEWHQADRQCNYGTIDQIGRRQVNYCHSTSNTDPSLMVNDYYSYDQSAYGNLDSVTSNTSGVGVTTAYHYDPFHNIVSKTQTNLTPHAWGYAANPQTVGYNYWNGARLSGITYPSGNQVNYNYSSGGMLANITLNGQYLVSSVAWDGANRLAAFAWGNGDVWQQWLNDQGLVQEVKNTDSHGVQMFDETYGYDNDGRMTQKTRNQTNVSSYSYDSDSQLSYESLTSGQTGYSSSYYYDSNGNRTSLKSSMPGVYTTTYNAGSGNQYSSVQNTAAYTLTYSSQGELTTFSGLAAATYDDAGRRRKETGVPGSTVYTGQYFDYNDRNERTFRGGSYIDRQYAYDEQSHLIGEYDANGKMVVEYVWFGDRPIAAVYPGNRIVYIITDYQSKPRIAIDLSTHNLVWYWNPDAFGAQQPTDGTNGLSGGVVINLRFPGQYYDVQSGLYYNHNRYYNPMLGRYMEPDPTGLEAGLNPYEYAGNNPVGNVDPTGLDVEEKEMTEAQSDSLGSMVAAADVASLSTRLKEIDSNASTSFMKPNNEGYTEADADVLRNEISETENRIYNQAEAKGECSPKTDELTFGETGRKLDFLFNKNINQSNSYNAMRAEGNASRMGIADTPENRSEVTGMFNKAYNDPSTIIESNNGRNTREFFLPGITGTGSKIQFVEHNGNVITIMAK